MITTQRELKRAIYDTAKNLTDADIFQSDVYDEFLTQMQHGVTSCSHLGTSTLLRRETDFIARTDGENTYITYDSTLTKGKTKEERHRLFCGLNLHECGHLLFTDFALNKLTLEKLQGGEIYPSPLQNPYLEEVEQFLHKGYSNSILELYMRLYNCIEDGFVDRAVMKLAPGYAGCLRYTNKVDRVVEFQTYDQMRARELSDEKIFLCMVLFYARHGLIAYTDSTPYDEVIEAFEEIKGYISDAVFEPNPIQRRRKAFVVFCYLFHFVAFQNEQPEQQDQQRTDENQSQSSQTNQSNGSSNNQSKGSSQEQSNSSSKSGENTSEEQTQGTSDSKETVEESDGNSTEQDQNSDSSNGQSQNGEPSDEESQNGEPSDEQSQSGEPSNGKDTDVSDENNNSKSQQARTGNMGSQPISGDAEKGMDLESLKKALEDLGKQIPNTERTEHRNSSSPQKEAISELLSALEKGDQKDADSSSPDEGETPAEDTTLNKIAEKVAESQVSKKQEADINAQMQCDVKKFLDGVAAHKRVSSSISRQAVSTEAKARYEWQHTELDSIVRRMISEFEREIKDRQTGDTLYGLYSGKRFSSREAYRFDKKTFNRKILPEDIPNMAIGIMVDLSGSMSGTRIQEAIKTVYITYTFCRKLNIPVFVVGHSTNGTRVALYSVVDENSLDDKDKYRIFGMNTYDCNRDGYALRYCLQKLENIQAEDKLMLVISDGRPNHYGYGEMEGKRDCQDAVAEAIKKGIFTITAGIGDAESVKGIYKTDTNGKNLSDRSSATYMDLSDLKKLPKSFVKIIKERLS